MSRESEVGKEVRQLVARKGFHMGGVIKGTNAPLRFGEVPVILPAPRLPPMQTDGAYQKFQERAVRAAMNAKPLTVTFAVDVEPFEDVVARAWVNVATTTLLAAIDEEGCGAVFAAMKTWSDD